MFDKNEYMRVPEDENTAIWGYMSIDKFKSLLAEKALYFCSAKRFKDAHEGAFSKLNI